MFETVLKTGADGMGLSLPAGVLPSLRAYHDFLYERNAVMDLTAVPPGDDAARSHFLDSLALLPSIPSGASVLDVGSGAGFPGLPLRLAEPSLHLTLLDANSKRTGFLAELCRVCGAVDVEILTGRAEELALLPPYRDRFDVVLSRAVARLPMLCELCLPFVRPGGLFLAMKAGDCGEEMDSAARAVGILGGRFRKPLTYTLPDTDVARTVVCVEKCSPTPAAYPRRFAKIKAKPL